MLRLIRFRMPILVIFSGFILIISACGTRATELRPTFEPTTTFDFTARQIAQGDTDVVAVRPTNTQVPPSATPVPPTPVPTLEPTDEPEPTEAPTEVAETTGGDPDDGAVLFEEVIGSTGHTCKTCHNPDEPVPGLGPYLYGIATVAGTRIDGLSAEEYLYQSITDPRAFLAPPQETVGEWPDNLMPDDWIDYLGEDGIQDIIAYLMTLDQAR